jgi:hypothetical protein
VVPYYIESAVCLGSAILGIKAASESNVNLWGISFQSPVLTVDLMSRLSKDGNVIHPTEEDVDNKILSAKYCIYKDMADTQIRYRKEIDVALS